MKAMGIKAKPKGAVPFICPGGIISRAVLEVMQKPASYWCDIYLDADKLYQLAKAMHEQGILDNYAVPLCFTVEAELFGAQIDYHASFCELKIREYPFADLKELLNQQEKNTRRRELVLEVIRRLKTDGDDIPVIGNITGPVTLLTQLVAPDIVFKAMARSEDLVQHTLQKLTSAIGEYGRQQIEAGADMLILGEPTANGEILGAAAFARFCTPHLRKLLQSLGKHLPEKIILHICGKIDNLLTELKKLPFSVLSVDSTANIKNLRQNLKHKIIIGSVCTHTLAEQTPAHIKALSRRIINQGVDALSLPCGLNPATPLENLKAMHEAALESKS
jgi:[methyl-Co(III) methanol-specific corrinoid protein]:coenzyme M methyltransferase